MLPAAPYTIPVAGEDWLRPARAHYVRQSLRRLLDWPLPLPGFLVPPYNAARETVASLYRSHPMQVSAALLLPAVGAPLHAGALGIARPTLLLELARRRLLPAEGVWWSAPVAALTNPPLGVARRYDPPLVGVLFMPGRVSTARHDEWELVGIEDAFRGLACGGWFALGDANPLAHIDAHPEKAGNTIALGEASTETWMVRINEARALIRGVLPDLASEHELILSCITPVGTDAERSLSASYREAIGQVYVSLHPDPVIMAEALVHECQHNKANLLSYSDPLLQNADTFVVSPVRPDLRPLWGLLLAVHAFLPVEAMLRELVALGSYPTAPERLRAVRRVNREGMAVLRQEAVTTVIGARLLAGLDALAREFDASPLLDGG